MPASWQQISPGKMLHAVLTLLLELWLNSLKMYPTTSHAEQLWALALSSSLMKCRTALLTCQGSSVVSTGTRGPAHAGSGITSSRQPSLRYTRRSGEMAG